MSKIKRLLFQIILTALIGFGVSLFFAETGYALSSTEAKIENSPSSISVGLFSEMRTVRNEEQVLQNSQISGFEIGLIRADFTFSLEGNSSENRAGRDQIVVSSKRNEVYFWTRWSAYKMKYFSLYGGLGVGGTKTMVDSNIAGNHASDESGIEGIGGGALGVQFNLFRNNLALQLEGRGLVAKSFDPSPTSSILFKLVFIEPFFE